MDQSIINTYNRDSEKLIEQYESKTFEQVHEYALPYLPEQPSTVLEIGAGSGRDSAWFASKGHHVVAVEPASELRIKAQHRHSSPAIRWIDDSLPSLEKVTSLNLTFDVIWLSAVWMHLPDAQRERAFRKLTGMLRPGGRIMISLRHGPPPEDRKVYSVSVGELLKYSRERGLTDLCIQKAEDTYNRDDVWWQTVVLHRPDNGTCGLPLLRHITLNDGKSSTYKLALLRCLARIADSSTGMAEYSDPDYVTLPLGLVGLFWIRQYKPLLDKGFPQSPTAGLGFVKAPFKALTMKPELLKPGATFYGGEADSLRKALRDAASTIRTMPSRFITYPGTEDPVFLVESRRLPAGQELSLTRELLYQYGTFKVPTDIWQSMSSYAVWIEPALITQWIEMMRRYEKPEPTSTDQHLDALQWIDPTHDTLQVRAVITKLQASGNQVKCVWRGSVLRGQTYQVDHLFPFAHWPCNDLWNLAPCSSTINSQKSNKLPSVQALAAAKERITKWWEQAYFSDSTLKSQFINEAQSTLPGLLQTPSVDDVFEAVIHQQLRIQTAQQLTQWEP